MKGTLYIVATPIGNLEDITLRALRTLKEVSFIACEDTRKTGRLLQAHGIENKPLLSYHNYNERSQTVKIISMLEEGKHGALVSNAGTPLISDPGFNLVKGVTSQGLTISPIPGVSALTTAISVSSIPTSRFHFEGFLPRSKGRKKRLHVLANLGTTTFIFYESPHRILKLFKDIIEILGDKQVLVAREMTKIYEEFFFAKVSDALKNFQKKKPQGEFVVILGDI